MKRDQTIDLDGFWRFRLDPEMLGEHYPEQLDIPWSFDFRWMNLDHDEREWQDISVPSCWQEHGYHYNGAAWYRKQIQTNLSTRDNQRIWLNFEGVDYLSDVWINEHYLGSHEGYFSSFEYEITPYIGADKNLVVVRVESPNDISAKETQYGQLKNIIKGALQRWDANNPEVNPGGIWNHVEVYTTGPGKIQDIGIQTAIHQLPPDSDIARPVPASLILTVSISGAEDITPSHLTKLTARLRRLDREHYEFETSLPIQILPGSSSWPLVFNLEQAYLWFTWDLGTPHLYELEVTLEVNGRISDRVYQTFGFRKIERSKGWETYLNGIRFYQRGANYLSDQYLSSMDKARYQRDIALLREANLNTVHPFAVVEKQIFYSLCDEAGILVYQDFPMWLTMDNSSDLARRAEYQLKELIAQFHHHPSIAIWNFGSQPSVANFEKLGALLTHTAQGLDPSRIAHQANSMIDRHGRELDPLNDYKWHRKRIKEFQEKYDWRVDTHQYYGWYWADLEALKSVPVEDLELVTEYGAQALPDRDHLEEFIPALALYPPDWSFYTRRCFQPQMQFDHICLPTNLEEMIQASQDYQARFIKYHTEYYRRHKYTPNNGAHYFCFNDCWPAITWSVVDYRRERKPGFMALQQAMAPLQVFLEFTDKLIAGQNNAPTVWLVNDFPTGFAQLQLDWQLRILEQPESIERGSIQLQVGANSKREAGKLGFAFDKSGKYLIDLRLESQGEFLISNSYEILVLESSLK
jgi:beta-mannosidase